MPWIFFLLMCHCVSPAFRWFSSFLSNVSRTPPLKQTHRQTDTQTHKTAAPTHLTSPLVSLLALMMPCCPFASNVLKHSSAAALSVVAPAGSAG